MSGRFSGWRLALRLARRDVRRARGRTALVLLMIALPVLAVTAADVVYATSSLNTRESLDRRIGTADARLVAQRGTTRVVQWIDPDQSSALRTHGHALPTLADAERLLGRDLPAVAVAEQDGVRLPTAGGATYAEVVQTDLRSPLTEGLFRLTAGRLPRAAGEVAVNPVLVADGHPVGSSFTLHGAQVRVVGVVRSATYRTEPVLAAAPGTLRLPVMHRTRTWLVGGGPVTWPDVRALNAAGFAVLSRSVVDDPPPADQKPAELRDYGGDRSQSLEVLALVVTMALLEVVLLAGPAFAVGARRQSRTLALMAASGGTPGQARRVVIASGVVLGALAAVSGVGLGIVVARLVQPGVQRLSVTWFGPFDVRWTHLAGIAAFGLLSAVLAAVVPAWIASRQDVVAVLAGRRGDRRPTLRSPLLGVLLLAAGIAGSAAGARQGAGEYLIAASAVVSVLGMILLVPVLLVGLARVSQRMPLVGRYAVRDAARHRTRTVPAVAAVAATVAGVVALGIATSSNEAHQRAAYVPVLPLGEATISAYEPHPDWQAYADAASGAVPGVRIVRIMGVRGVGLRFHAPGDTRQLTGGYSATFDTDALVAGRIADLPTSVPPAARVAARRMLARGGAVLLTRHSVTAHRVVVRRSSGHAPVAVRALYVDVGEAAGALPIGLVLSPQAAASSRLPVHTVGLLLTGAISSSQENTIQERLLAMSSRVGLYVERGYQADSSTRIVQLVLGVLGAVLMLGGTLTATFLALSDARPDLATLAAVGAAPRVRRSVAAAYALVVGLVGALLGAAVGFIPGLAVTYPLTAYTSYPTDIGHTVAVPWTLVGVLVVGLPLLTAVVVGLTARARLPLVARLD